MKKLYFMGLFFSLLSLCAGTVQMFLLGTHFQEKVFSQGERVVFHLNSPFTIEIMSKNEKEILVIWASVFLSIGILFQICGIFVDLIHKK